MSGLELFQNGEGRSIKGVMLMDKVKPMKSEESLDPDDWQAIRALGHRMVDDIMTYLETIRDIPCGSQSRMR